MPQLEIPVVSITNAVDRRNRKGGNGVTGLEGRVVKTTTFASQRGFGTHLWSPNQNGTGTLAITRPPDLGSESRQFPNRKKNMNAVYRLLMAGTLLSSVVSIQMAT